MSRYGPVRSMLYPFSTDRKKSSSNQQRLGKKKRTENKLPIKHTFKGNKKYFVYLSSFLPHSLDLSIVSCSWISFHLQVTRIIGEGPHIACTLHPLLRIKICFACSFFFTNACGVLNSCMRLRSICRSGDQRKVQRKFTHTRHTQTSKQRKEMTKRGAAL